jgi:predicted phosphoribosyltransferase
MRFANRRAAGVMLAEKLAGDLARVQIMPSIVLALPRGGVCVAYEIALHLKLALDIWLVRKVGVPGYEELAAGAIADGGVVIWNRDVLTSTRLTPADLQPTIERERAELERRRVAYCGRDEAPEMKERSVILVDDGLATGASMLAAIESVKEARASSVWVAVPVAAPDTVARLRPQVDGVTCLLMPENLRAIGLWYDDFTQTSDEEVVRLLAEARAELR